MDPKCSVCGTETIDGLHLGVQSCGNFNFFAKRNFIQALAVHFSVVLSKPEKRFDVSVTRYAEKSKVGAKSFFGKIFLQEY